MTTRGLVLLCGLVGVFFVSCSERSERRRAPGAAAGSGARTASGAAKALPAPSGASTPAGAAPLAAGSGAEPPRLPFESASGGGSALGSLLCRSSLSPFANQRKLGFLAGFVFDAAEEPIEGATVIAYNEMGSPQRPVETDERGFFRHDTIHGYSITEIVVSGEGFVKSRLVEADLRRDQNWDLVRVPLSRQGAVLEGTLVDQAGSPLFGATVEVFWEHPKQQPFEFWSQLAVTDATGSFRLEDVPGGALWIARRSARQTRQELQRLVVEAGRSKRCDWEAAGGLRLSGSFELVGHEAATAQEILLRRYGQDDDEPALVAAQVCDETRGFAFDRLSPGRYLLQVHLSRELFTRHEVELNADHDLGVLQLQREHFMESLLSKLRRDLR